MVHSQVVKIPEKQDEDCGFNSATIHYHSDFMYHVPLLKVIFPINLSPLWVGCDHFRSGVMQ